MVVRQYDIFLVSFDPTVGHEIQQTRPRIVLSPDEMNHHIKTAIVAPMTTKSHSYPTRVALTFRRKQGWIVLDQIRTVDRKRLQKKLGKASAAIVSQVKSVISEMLVE